jgi:hypothetical protein
VIRFRAALTARTAIIEPFEVLPVDYPAGS